MAWMVELLTYDEEVAANDHVEGGDPNDDGEKLFLDYLGKSYQAFMWYDDGKYEALDEELRETFQGRTAGLKREVESLQEEMEALKSEHATLSADKSPVTTLKSRRAELLGDRKKFEELVSKLEERHATAKTTLDARRADLSAKGACAGAEGGGQRWTGRRRLTTSPFHTEAEFKDLKEACEDLRQRIAAQDVSAQDAERMSAERKCVPSPLHCPPGTRTQVHRLC